MKKLTKKECREGMLSILEYIDILCNQNNLSYSIMYGTLIGAIRHGGMIPWDDDIDIAMKRDDYIKLINIINNNDDCKYKIITWENDKKYCLPWGKVIDTSTVLNEKGKIISDNYGLFVDILPYDLIPNKFRRLMYFKRRIIFFFIKSFNFDKNYKNVRFYYFKYIRNKISRLFGKNFFFKKYDKLCRKYNDKKNYSYSACPYMFKKLKKIEIKEFNHIKRINFEGKKVNAFENYDMILKEYYGDYMTPPPKKDRQNHNLTAYKRDDII